MLLSTCKSYQFLTNAHILGLICILSIITPSAFVYSESSNDILEHFYYHRENFLQVDIFFKEVNYQQITQHPAFELISLFSEVGGFMGLLLGASVITVFEFLDYLWMLIIATVSKRQKVAPRQAKMMA